MSSRYIPLDHWQKFLPVIPRHYYERILQGFSPTRYGLVVHSSIEYDPPYMNLMPLRNKFPHNHPLSIFHLLDELSKFRKPLIILDDRKNCYYDEIHEISVIDQEEQYCGTEVYRRRLYIEHNTKYAEFNKRCGQYTPHNEKRWYYSLWNMSDFVKIWLLDIVTVIVDNFPDLDDEFERKVKIVEIFLRHFSKDFGDTISNIKKPVNIDMHLEIEELVYIFNSIQLTEVHTCAHCCH